MSASRTGGADARIPDEREGGADRPAAALRRSRTALVRRARQIDRTLAETYPDADIELDFRTPLELLVATILAAQSTDKRVNSVTAGALRPLPATPPPTPAPTGPSWRR